jgi:RNA polymerase primary sigma factor
LLTLGVIIKLEEDDSDEDELFANDRSKLDYSEIFDEILLIQPELETFIEYARNITPPQHREWQNLIHQAQNGNAYARNRLVEMYLRVVIKQALYCYKKYQVSLEDTIQNGILGLITAIKKYNPAEQDKFPTYAPWWINQFIYRRMRIYNNPMYFPVHVKTTVFTVQEMIEEHYNSNCSCPDINSCEAFVNELQKKLDCEKDSAKQFLHYLSQWTSLDYIDHQSFELSDHGLLDNEMVESVNAIYTNQTILTIIACLKDREREVLLYRFGFFDGQPRTLEQVGVRLGVTRERVRQIEAKVLQRLRSMPSIQKLISL